MPDPDVTSRLVATITLTVTRADGRVETYTSGPFDPAGEGPDLAPAPAPPAPLPAPSASSEE